MTEVFSVAYIHNFYGLSSDEKFIKIEDYQKLEKENAELKLQLQAEADKIDALSCKNIELSNMNAELEKSINCTNETFLELQKAKDQLAHQENKIKMLLEENDKLKDGTVLKELTAKCKDQAELICKLTTCCNCKHSAFTGIGDLDCNRSGFTVEWNDRCDKWEFDE